jgi:predicted alpha/beta-fold hydrolase
MEIALHLAMEAATEQIVPLNQNVLMTLAQGLVLDFILQPALEIFAVELTTLVTVLVLIQSLLQLARERRLVETSQQAVRVLLREEAALGFLV